MKRLNRLNRTFVVLWFAAIVMIAIPACSGLSDHADSGAHATDSEGEQGSLERLLLTAQSEFHANHVISETLARQFQQQKERVIPIVTERLSGHSGQTPAKEMPFWLMMAQVVNDERVLAPLLHWLSDPPPDLYDHYVLRPDYFQALAAYITEDHVMDLTRSMEEAGAQSAALILEILQSKNLLDEEQIQAWEDQYFQRPQFEGIVHFLTLQRKNDQLMHLYESKDLSDNHRHRIIESMVWGGPFSADERAWLQQQARRTDDRYIEQLIDAQLIWRHGDQEAAQRLYDSGTGHGFAMPLGSSVEQFLAKMVPNGTLARGIQRYEQIRGRNYFIQPMDGWYEAGGDDYDRPKQAIPRWEVFIRDYPLHPAADDAAYRLARCYQMTGQYGKALYWFNQAVRLGDRDMVYDAEGMFLYVLDVEMTSDDFAQLDSGLVPAWAEPWLAYSRAVEWLRDRDYRKAAEAFQAFIAEYDGKDIFREVFDTDPENPYDSGLGPREYPFWENVKEQLTLAGQMANLSRQADQAEGSEKAKKQYELAAAIYHQPLLYYNYLWRGERQTFFMFGHIKTMEYNEAMSRYIARFNHLAQAQAVFAQIDLDQADAETGAKTLFSEALSFSKLIEYGDEIAFYDTDTHLGQRMTETVKSLLKRYPDSPLADDGMMLIYHYTGDSTWLDKIIERYPTGDQADKAKKIKDEMLNTKKADHPWQPPDPLQSYALTQRLAAGDWRIPSEIAQWTKANKGTEYRGWKEAGDWLYVYVSAGAGNKAAGLNIINNLSGTQIVYAIAGLSEHDASSKQDMLFRLPTRFVQMDSVRWKLQ